ncbi:MAG: phytoene desaturase family protein [Crocinitomicaceae bacterium]
MKFTTEREIMQHPDSYDVVIIGGGASGLASAIRLKKRFKNVLLIEKNPRAGGKLDDFEWNGYRWDKGPSVFTEPNNIDQLFELWDKNPREYFNFEPLKESCTYYFPDHQSITISSDRDKTREQIAAVAGTQGNEEFEKYLQDGNELFEKVGNYFISNPRPTAAKAFKKELTQRYKYFLRKEVRQSLHQLNERSFSNEYMVKIFDRFGTYIGSNPYKMSGLYSTISHVEINKGAFFPKGGMRAIVESLITLAKEIGVEIQCSTQVQVHPQSDGTYNTSGDMEVSANRVICAIDHMTFYNNVLIDQKMENRWRKIERSTSALVFYWAMKTGVKEFGVHNIFFSDDYKKEFSELFDKRQLADAPTFYIHISSVAHEGDAPEGGQNWFTMVNVPAGVLPDEAYREKMKDLLAKRLKEQFDFDMRADILFEDRWDCAKIQEHSGSYLGALYGPASNSLLSSIKRHGNTNSKYPNMYFCGGTVHPGGGIPLVLRSAKIVSELIK